MKQLKLLAILLTTTLLWSGCGSDGHEETPISPKLEFDDTPVTFNNKVGDQTKLTIESNKFWELKNAPSWLKVHPSAGLQGTTEVVLSIQEANESSNLWSGKLVFASDELEASLEVFQRYIDLLQVVEPANKELLINSPKAIGFEIMVRSNIDYKINIVGDGKNWIKYQEPIKPEEPETPEEGDENEEGEETPEEDSARNGGPKINTERFVITKPVGNEERSATITFKAGDIVETVTITQVQQDAIVVEERSKESQVSFTGGLLDIYIKTNVPYEILIPTVDKDWVKVLLGREKAMRDHEIKLEVMENNEYKDRETHLILKHTKSDIADTILIKQAKKQAILLEPTGIININTAKAEDFNVKVSANVDYEVRIPGNINWITQAPSTRNGLEEVTHRFAVQANPNPATRTTEIKFINKNNPRHEEKITVTQKQDDQIIVADNIRTLLETEGELYQFYITSNLQYKISSSASWLKPVQTRANELVDKLEKLQADVNTTGANRTAKITIAAEGTEAEPVEIDFTQNAAKLEVSADHQNFIIPAKGSTYTLIEILSNVKIEAKPEANWVTIERIKSSIWDDTHTIEFSTDANTDTSMRQTKITIYNEDLNMHQDVIITQEAASSIP